MREGRGDGEVDCQGKVVLEIKDCKIRAMGTGRNSKGEILMIRDCHQTHHPWEASNGVEKEVMAVGL